jgi:Ca-activated chloride channel family protein
MMFLNVGALLLLAILPVWIVFFGWRSRTRQSILRQLGEIDLIGALFSQVSSGRRRWKSTLWICTLAALIIAIARPVWGVDLDVVQTQGVSVMIALDVSNSMEAQDILPNRLERAKLAIRDLLNGLAGNEIGLIVFAGTAYVQFPLTTDPVSAVSFLNAVSTDSISRQGTAIEDALRLAIETFGEQSPAARIVVLMTDGENHEGNPLGAADEAAEEGITIYTVGYGDPDEGVPIPVMDASGNIINYKIDQAGDVVVSRLDEEILESIAERSGGVYQRASASGVEIANLVNQIREAEAGDLGSRTATRGVERYGIFVALALLALSLEMLLPETRTVP